VREFSQCGFFEGRIGAAGASLTHCPHPASFTGVNADSEVSVACIHHHHLLGHAHAIHGFDSVDEETLTRVAENQADLEQLLDSGGT
jgi:hypothetical protein